MPDLPGFHLRRSSLRTCPRLAREPRGDVFPTSVRGHSYLLQSKVQNLDYRAQSRVIVRSWVVAGPPSRPSAHPPAPMRSGTTGILQGYDSQVLSAQVPSSSALFDALGKARLLLGRDGIDTATSSRGREEQRGVEALRAESLHVAC